MTSAARYLTRWSLSSTGARIELRRLPGEREGRRITVAAKKTIGQRFNILETAEVPDEIERREPRVGRPQTNAFVERFNHTALDEFSTKAFRKKF